MMEREVRRVADEAFWLAIRLSETMTLLALSIS